ncbi:MAG: ferrous iron transporter B, partial [Bdellovibrionota bacterium]
MNMHATMTAEKKHPAKSIALVGSPNSGKTTLYNWLTASSFKTVNYPGATVEYSLGQLANHLHPWYDNTLQVMDTPGTYSLHPKSADEVVTLKSIYENPQVGRVEAILVVVDATQMDRHLVLAQQVKETGFPMMIVITMADLLRKKQIELDLESLQAHFQCPIVMFDGIMGAGLKEIVQELKDLDVRNIPTKPYVWDEAQQEAKIKSMEALATKALQKKPDARERIKQLSLTTEKLDRIFLHPVLGLVIFFLVMFGVFSGLFWIAAPFMDAIDTGFSFLGEQLTANFPEGLLADFLANGLIASLGGVLIFIPQIFILFFLIGALEGSGYLARAATLIDRPFSKSGLSGRSFVPLLSGFACAIPALMATRNIPSQRDRWITNFIIPLMTCSARLPVYALLLTFLFHGQSAWKPGFALALLYMAALFVGAIAALILNKFLPKGTTSLFMMELPIYRRPRWKVLFF